MATGSTHRVGRARSLGCRNGVEWPRPTLSACPESHSLDHLTSCEQQEGSCDQGESSCEQQEGVCDQQEGSCDQQRRSYDQGEGSWEIKSSTL